MLQDTVHLPHVHISIFKEILNNKYVFIFSYCSLNPQEVLTEHVPIHLSDVLILKHEDIGLFRDFRRITVMSSWNNSVLGLKAAAAEEIAVSV